MRRMHLVVPLIAALALVVPGSASAGERVEVKRYLGDTFSFPGQGGYDGACHGLAESDACFGEVIFDLTGIEKRVSFVVADTVDKVVGGFRYFTDETGAPFETELVTYCGGASNIIVPTGATQLHIGVQTFGGVFYACPYRTPSLVTTGTVTATFTVPDA